MLKSEWRPINLVLLAELEGKLLGQDWYWKLTYTERVRFLLDHMGDPGEKP